MGYLAICGCFLGGALLCNHRFFAQSGTSSNFLRNKTALARIASAKTAYANQPSIAQ